MATSPPESPHPVAVVSSNPSVASDAHGAAVPRRGFLSLLAIVAGGIAGLIPVAAAAIFFMDPVVRKRKGAGVGMLRAANLSELPADGTPVRVTLRSDVIDAWTIYRDRVIGSIYLRLMPNGEVLAFNDTCTHLGCKVDYQAADKRFFCPCHQSAFDLDGKRTNETPPRDLDILSVEIKSGDVWVKYQDFRTATEKQEAI